MLIKPYTIRTSVLNEEDIEIAIILLESEPKYKKKVRVSQSGEIRTFLLILLFASHLPGSVLLSHRRFKGVKRLTKLIKPILRGITLKYHGVVIVSYYLCA